MAIPDQNKYIQFVNLLSHNDFFKNVNGAVVSPLFNKICIVNKQRDAFLYSLPNGGSNIEPFWRCPSKVQRCFFSEDGRHLLVILSVNSFQIYTINDDGTNLAVQIKASVMAHLLQPFKMDFSAACKVHPLKLKLNNLIIKIDNKILASLEWSLIGNPVIKFTIPLSNHLDIFVNDKFIYILNNSGIINAYNILTGQKCQDELNACLANRTNSDISVGTSFSKISVHPTLKILAIVNQDEETVIFDMTDLFEDVKNEPAAPVEVKKEKWLWSGKIKKPVNEGKVNNGKVTGKITPIRGLVVCYLHFSMKGLFIFYSILGQSKCISFKVIDEYSGDTLFSFEGLVESTIVMGGSLPLVMSDSILSICLGVLCNDCFIMRCCEIIPSFGFSKELEKTLLSHQALSSSHYHLSFLKIVLNLHSNHFRYNLQTLTKSKDDEQNDKIEINLIIKKMIEKIDHLFKVVLELQNEEKIEEMDLKQEMLILCFRHAVRLLDLVHIERKKTVSIYGELFSGLLRNLLTLFPYVKHLDPLKDEWVTWRNMSDVEVVQEAVVVGAVALAHVFFVTDRDWPVNEVEARFKEESLAYIVELISIGDLEKAKLALANLGCNPLDHLKSLCLDTNEPLMRDLLANHLMELGELKEEEIEALRFCRKIEGALSSVIKRYHTFEHKMTVSARDRVKIVMFKLPAYNGSIDLQTVLKYSNKWREEVLTEVYFSTGDITLEKDLTKETSWLYLLEMNQIDLLKNWIDINCNPNILEPLLKLSDYLTKSFYTLFSGWKITEKMLDSVNDVKCMTSTKDSILDHCASFGLFSSFEKLSLRDIIYRVENNSLLPAIRNVLSAPTSNVKLEDFDQMILSKCIPYDLKTVILSCLSESAFLKESTTYRKEFPWLDVWQLFKNWESSKNNKTYLLEAIKKSSEIVSLDAQDAPLLEIALALIEEKEISEVIEKEGNELGLLQIPLVEIGWQTAQGTSNRTPDVSLYDLLGHSNVPIDKLFLWQSQNKHSSETPANEIFTEFPHFNHQVLAVKYGFKQNLDYIYYLKQGRPSFACNLFIVESLRTQRRLTTKMIKRACGLAHGLALRHWRDPAIGNACVAFITMLGDIASANILRIHLAAIDSIVAYLSNGDKNYISTLLHGIVFKESATLQEMALLLESSVMESMINDKPIAQLKKWALPVSFCNTHNLPLPTMFPKYLAKNHHWFPFVVCLDIFKYPYEQAIELIEEINSKILKSHLIRALTRTTLKLSTTSPSKSPPKILLEPESSGKDDPEVSSKDAKDVFHFFVTNIYTEVLNTIQTFTDRNIVLPWSCEQDPDSDVLLTLLKCESEPDTSKSLLISSIELQSPVLAVLATCFQSDNVFPNLIAWLISAIPTTMSRIKRREEGQQLVDRHYGPKEVDILLTNFFSTGYFQTFYRGMTLFMSDNPLTLFIESVYQAVVVLDFSAALDVLKDFVVEMNHRGLKESTPFSKSWILKVVAQFVENLLIRPDVLNSVKRQFLRILANSDLASVDPSFPNYLLWYQICEILESSETNLDFVRLYDITMVSEELQNCLDDLMKNHQYTHALEICSLLSLNKDKLIVAMWTHQMEVAMKSGSKLKQLWTDSSIAFKDENVNPNLAASFYYDMAMHFEESTPESLENKYLALDFCLHWRRCIEDTSTTSFREESDSIELEKWKCCIDPNFDLSVLKSIVPVDVSYSLLVSIWSSSKVLVRSQIVEESIAEQVEALINMFLDQGDLHRALRISAFFKSNNQDLVTITSCLKVTHGEVTPNELSKYNATLIITPKKLTQKQANTSIDLTEYDVAASKEQQQMLTILDKLCQTVNHGQALANKILVCYRLSVNLDSTFKDIASERDYLGLLTRSVSAECVNKLGIARDLITLADLPGTELAKFLKDRIVAAIVEFHTNNLMIPTTLWDVNLESDFHLIINLIENPSLLGLELLNASISLPSTQAVEVLIRAHDCYTTCCNVEGIGRVLRRARILASQVLQEQQWQYLVKMLVGIGRYNDMSYVFQMLKDNDQFEYLLRKGMHKAPGLHVAVSDFLQRHCPEDRELGKMVAVHFGLHSKVAELWKAEADESISKLPVVDNILKDSSKTRQILNTAMDSYSHAAQWFLQAGKLNRALKISHQAQMVALQISLLGGPLVLKIQTHAQFQTLVNESLSVAQTVIAAKACDMEPDWAGALYERWVMKGDKTFFSDFKSSNLLTPQLLHVFSHRFDIDQISNSKAKDRMKQLKVPLSQQQSPLLKDLKKT